MEQYVRQNFEKAMQLPMPTKTFAKLKAADHFIALTVRPGIINKHLTSAQLNVLAKLAGEGAVKYSAGHSFIVSVHEGMLDEVMQRLTDVELYVVPPTPSAIMKCCDFCDGDELAALPIAKELLREIEQMPLKKRVRIGFNACTLACYNAVQDDLALIYHKGKFDIYGGAIPMGRRASSGELLAKNIPEQYIIECVEKLLLHYNTSNVEKFFRFIKKEKESIQQYLKGDWS